MKITVASGKGGTGKTTVSLAIARLLSKRYATTLIDCDVEEPNVGNFVNGSMDEIEIVTIDQPVIDRQKCTLCGTCSSTCRYNALACLKDSVMTFPELCNGCGACGIVCKHDAISFNANRIGKISRIREEELEILEGRLDTGQAKAVPVISAAKDHIEREITVLDSPPGSSCPVIETARGSDIIILVSEPTRFGIHDLNSVYKSLKDLDIPMLVIENKAGSGSEDIGAFCEKNGVELVGSIPMDRGIAEVYARGGDPAEEVVIFRDIITSIGNRLITIKEGG